ncbi:MAG TPA: SET domain-containing protein-lysine N-methyltransferase [Candidatus Limnocylindria bacterium]|nr:SET domain-containing protein-lysine N-methyltransferase [Candidatus Limnocylindria bacterium]
METNLVSQSELYEVRASGIHGTGVFARTHIPTDTAILEYVGERLEKEESLRRRQANNFFIFTVTDDFDIDGAVEWNPARFINHSCAPNCEAQEDEERIWIMALRDLQPGEELTFNYGYDLEDYEEHICRCGAPNCLGFMVAEEYFEDVQRKEAQKR